MGDSCHMACHALFVHSNALSAAGPLYVRGCIYRLQFHIYVPQSAWGLPEEKVLFGKVRHAHANILGDDCYSNHTRSIKDYKESSRMGKDKTRLALIKTIRLD